MPTAEAIRNFLLNVVLPPVVGVAAAWIVGTVHVLNLFGITEGQVAGEITQFATWGIVTLIAFLHTHNVLLGNYTPAAKAAAAARRSSL